MKQETDIERKVRKYLIDKGEELAKTYDGIVELIPYSMRNARRNNLGQKVLDVLPMWISSNGKLFGVRILAKDYICKQCHHWVVAGTRCPTDGLVH